MDEDLALFYEDASDQLSIMEEALLDISDHGVNEENIGGLFRAMHTIKGTAGMFGYDELVSFTHMHLKQDHQGIVITQHMPVGFTASFASRLNSTVTNSNVVEAKEGDVICNSTVYIAKGGIHMKVKKQGNKYIIELENSAKVNSHKPSVNVLFNSIATFATKEVTAFILTGMGDDGATGLKKLKDLGCDTYVQNEKTATVYGMPRVAAQMGAAKAELSIFDITRTINNLE